MNHCEQRGKTATTTHWIRTWCRIYIRYPYVFSSDRNFRRRPYVQILVHRSFGPRSWDTQEPMRILRYDREGQDDEGQEKEQSALITRVLGRRNKRTAIAAPATILLSSNFRFCLARATFIGHSVGLAWIILLLFRLGWPLRCRGVAGRALCA